MIVALIAMDRKHWFLNQQHEERIFNSRGKPAKGAEAAKRFKSHAPTVKIEFRKKFAAVQQSSRTYLHARANMAKIFSGAQNILVLRFVHQLHIASISKFASEFLDSLTIPFVGLHI